MVDAAYSRQRAKEDRAAEVRRQLSVFAAGLAVILIGLGGVLLQRGFGGSSRPNHRSLPQWRPSRSQKNFSRPPRVSR